MARFGSGVWARSFKCLCACASPTVRSACIPGRLGLVSAHVPTIFKTDLRAILGHEKWRTWTVFISNSIWLFGTCEYITSFVFFLCGGWPGEWYTSHCPSWSIVSGCSTRCDGCGEGREVSAADGNQAVILISPSCGISPKREGSCCRQRLRSHVTAELGRAGGGISWDWATLRCTSTHFWRGLSNSVCNWDYYINLFAVFSWV